MKKIKPQLKMHRRRKVILAICGGFQLLGMYYQSNEGNVEGLGLLDFHTKAGNRYFVGNTVVNTVIII